MVAKLIEKPKSTKKRVKDSGGNASVPKCLYSYIFRVVCFEYNIMSVEYFMDECTEWELNNIIANIPYTDRNMWETSRLNAFITAKAHFKGIKKFKDILIFPWEKEDEEEKEEEPHNYEISNEEIKRLKQLSENVKSKI